MEKIREALQVILLTQVVSGCATTILYQDPPKEPKPYQRTNFDLEMIEASLDIKDQLENSPAPIMSILSSPIPLVVAIVDLPFSMTVDFFTKPDETNDNSLEKNVDSKEVSKQG